VLPPLLHWRAFLPPAIRLRDDVRALSPGDYTRVRNGVAGLLAASPGVRAVYGFGSMAIPGVSDIDMLACCDDARLPAVRLAAREIRDRTPDGRFFFPHQIFILPASLAADWELLFMRPLAGQMTLLRGEDLLPRPSAASERAIQINHLIWSSCLWRNVAARRPSGSLRDLLLLLRSIRCSEASVRHADGTVADRGDWLASRAEERARIAALSGAERVRAARAAVAASLDAWWRAEWKLHDLWGSRRPAPGGARRIARLRVAFEERRPAIGVARGGDLVLPASMRDLGGLLLEAVDPARAASEFGMIDAQAALAAARQPWRSALEDYRAALRRAADVGRRLGNPAKLFLGDGDGIFPTPFNVMTDPHGA
jgi:hypothetical protein